MKKVVLVNCFDTYEDRIDLLYNFFMNKGHIVKVIQSDFRHSKKKYRQESKSDFIFIKTKPYYKNMSFARLISHYKFAKKAINIVEELNPDLLYVLIPPNSLAKFASNYKRRNKNIKLIFDLIDLWPETMPIRLVKNIPPFNFWKLMRNKGLNYADYVITECDLYKTKLGKILEDKNSKTLYLAKREFNYISKPYIDTHELQLCYLGSINNIIDIQKIKLIISTIQKFKPVCLNIIGDGENKNLLINEIKSTGASVVYHGIIYDPQKKQDIFDKCSFGLNIMKDSVCVGLTMKSIDYFQHGIPIINNIKGDTWNLVTQEGIGINVTGKDITETIRELTDLNFNELSKMREYSREVFNKYFSERAFFKRIDIIYSELY